MQNILEEDIQLIHSKIDFNRFAGTTVLITGATGLLGTAVVKAFLAWNQTSEHPVKIIALIRNKAKAETLFQNYPANSLEYLIGEIETIQPENRNIDYIIHGASATASKAFVNAPVETTKTALYGTINLLELAKANPVKSFVYLSSMEVYGTPSTDEKIFEDRPVTQNILNVRTCYPESKCMCENLCISYASEYGVPAKIVRLTQTFGTGVSYQDGRVFAEFARCAIEGKDIILKTKGETERNYLYTADAVTAILTVLLDGENGNAYNAANEETYCSIYDMANLVTRLSSKSIHVIIKESSECSHGYAPTLKMNLSCEKLKALGWKPIYGLQQMYERMIADMTNETVQKLTEKQKNSH